MLFRLYDPTRFGATALLFRHFGPLSRFDHHRSAAAPADDPDRGIIYAARSLHGCLAEIFGDTRIVQVDDWEIARLTVTRDFTLLDLRGPNAMKAGTVAAVCKDSNREYSQAWSRFFYETVYTYGTLDGLVWGNAHNDEDAMAFYERCQNDIQSGAADSYPLRDDALRVDVHESAAAANMFVQPY
jgi:hypothetical protein